MSEPIELIPCPLPPGGEGQGKAIWTAVIREFIDGGEEAVRLYSPGRRIASMRVGIAKQIARQGFAEEVGVAQRKGSIYLYRKEPAA